VGTVQVNRGVFVGLVAVAGVSLLAAAFLLGRASGPASAPSTPPAPGAYSAASPAVPAPASPARELAIPSSSDPMPASAPVLPTAPLLAAEPVPSPLPPSDPPGRAPSTPGPADPERTAVAAYLDAVDRIQPAEIGGSAESAASELAMALAKGDTSGLDAMIHDSEAAKVRLAAVVPPPPCAAHYRESAGSLDDGLEMLRALRDAVASPDPTGALLGVSTRASSLRARAEALQREDAALRQRYGLAR
jgi:hypothetical protein